VGGLEPPPAGRLRRANLHLPCSTASRSSTYIKLPSAFGTQVNSYVDFVAALPKTSTGKVRKYSLRETEWAGHDRRIQG